MRRRRQRTGAAQKRAHGPDARRDAASSAAVLCRSLSATAGGAVLWKKWLDRIIRSPKNTFSQVGGVIRFVLSRNDAVGPGGTANLAVLGGNLPPSRAHGDCTPLGSPSLCSAVRLVARQNGPVARSTQTPIESFRLSPWEYDSEQKAGQIGVTEVLSFGTVLLLANAS